MAEEKKHSKKGHPYSHTHVEHFADGTHHVHHVHESGDSRKDVHSGVGGHDELLDHIMDHTSQMNPGEAEANAGPTPVPGAPAPAGAPAAMPASGSLGA